jgi:hypothetical protein
MRDFSFALYNINLESTNCGFLQLRKLSVGLRATDRVVGVD